MSIFSFVPVLLTALIALLVYKYRNRIVFAVITIGGEIKAGNKQIQVEEWHGDVKAERLTIKNYGWRDLDNVELHFKVRTEPAAYTLKEASTISKKSVATEWADEVIKIIIPNFPSNEELVFETIRVGHYEPIDGRLKGTGGRYTVVRTELYELKRSIINACIAAIVLMSLPLAGYWLDTRKAPAQVASGGSRQSGD